MDSLRICWDVSVIEMFPHFSVIARYWRFFDHWFETALYSKFVSFIIASITARVRPNVLVRDLKITVELMNFYNCNNSKHLNEKWWNLPRLYSSFRVYAQRLFDVQLVCFDCSSRLHCVSVHTLSSFCSILWLSLCSSFSGILICEDRFYWFVRLRQ